MKGYYLPFDEFSDPAATKIIVLDIFSYEELRFLCLSLYDTCCKGISSRESIANSCVLRDDVRFTHSI